jgi:FMN reductase [NAD(P)H]
MNPVLESLLKHKSVRKYKNQPLEDEKLQLIIKAAQAAPTWCNGEQVSIIAVKDQAIKDKIRDLAWGQQYISTCSVFLVFCADFYRISIAFEKGGKTKEDFEKYITHIDTLVVGSHDVGIALQNATVAAESLGLGTVDIGAIRGKSLEITKLLNLPKYCIPLVGLCVGYPDDNPGIKPRLPMTSVCFDNKYDTEKAKAGVEEYDVTYQKYLSERDSNARDSNWSKSISKIYSSFSVDATYDLLKQQGFISIDKKK